MKLSKISLIILGLILLLIIILCTTLKNKSVFKTESAGESGNVTNSPDIQTSAGSSETKGNKELRGVWIASVYNIDFPSKAGLTAAEQKNEIDGILNEIKNLGMNAVFFQVRPCADALYNSKIFPISEYLTGQTGGKLKEDFDPLKYIIEKAHPMGIEVHAWVNPLRVTTGTPENPKFNVNDLANGHPAKLHPDWVVQYADGKLYFNPGIPEVRQLIIDGVTEIIDNYNVDGIHFDDYFYPYPKENAVFDDSAAFNKYGGGLGLEDFRRNNIDLLVKWVYDAIKAKKSQVSFGISPFAVWANIERNALGSDTNGGIETYYDLYADTRKWVKSNWLDYICPQIYWSITLNECKFGTVCDWWAEVVKDTNVKLMTGHAGHKVGNNADKAWNDPQELVKQITYAREKENYIGSIFYGYGNIKSNAIGIKDILKDYYSKSYTLKKTKSLIIAAPPEGMETKDENVYLSGKADPKYPLYLNGKVLFTTENGYFSTFLSLKKGKNTFTFKSNKNIVNYDVTRVIEKSPDVMDSFCLKSPNVEDDIIKLSGEKMPLRVAAPAGSIVTATIGEITAHLTTSGKIPSDGSVKGAEYSGEFQIPSVSGKVCLGNVTYKAEGFGKSVGLTSKGSIYAMSPDLRIVAEVTGEYGWIRDRPKIETLENAFVLAKGARDYVIGYEDGYYHLKSGGYISKNDVTLIENMMLKTGVITAPVLNVSDNTEFYFDTNENLFYKVTPNEDYIKLEIFNVVQKYIPVVEFRTNPLFLSVVSSMKDNVVTFIFNLKEKGLFYGYKGEFKDGRFVLSFKNPKHVKEGEKPLEGIKIALDPGHGNNSGALGPAWDEGLIEDDFNLDTALKLKYLLQEKGAEVFITREGPAKNTLSQIISMYKSFEPDLALSIHYNAVARNKDPLTVKGMYMYYSYPHSKKAAQILLDVTSEYAKRKKQSIKRDDFYLTRFYDCPSVLAELGFMSNIYEYEWFEKEENREMTAKGLMYAVLEYFSQ